MENLIEMARRLRPLIVKAAQSLTDAEAASAPQLYEEWKPDTAYEAGYKIRRGDMVYKVQQAHTSQTGWEPENAPALFAGIDEVHAGTKEDPIPYDGNMALESGKYYTQAGVLYRCTRDTINPVYHALADLVGIYVGVI